MVRLGLLFLLLFGCFGPSRAETLIVTGLGGDEEFSNVFQSWGKRAQERFKSLGHDKGGNVVKFAFGEFFKHFV